VDFRLKIVIAHNDYGRPSGEEHAIETIAGLVSRQGHQVAWFRRSSAGIRESGSRKLAAFFAGVANPFAARQFGQCLDRERPELVFVQNLYPFLSPSILPQCKRRGIPVVMRCPNYRLFCPNGLHLSHGEVCERCLGGKEYWCVWRNCEGNYFKSLGYALRNASARLTRRILDNVSVFAVLSEFQKRRFIAGGIPAERIEILPNVIPNIPAASEGIPGPGDLITFVGRVSPEKGIEDFVAAARALPGLPFAVAGATERMPELVARSPKNVRWLGFLKESELNEICRRSRMLVFPFRWFEGFPNVISRAMVLGKPVVAASIGAVPEIVTDGKTGLLFKPADTAELVARIQELYPDTDRCRSMGQAGREKALAQYSPEVVYKRLLEIFSKAVEAERL
jgi:glycosyltransferase involved in cell wall biosynthesis